MVGQRRTGARAAFTLVELPVVIAIIALLAAILFPFFAAARASARKATSTSNVRQPASVVLMYAAGYDETFPLQFGPVVTSDPSTFAWQGGTGKSTASWHNLVQPYMRNRAAMLRPGDARTSGRRTKPRGVRCSGFG